MMFVISGTTLAGMRVRGWLALLFALCIHPPA
jgi:hypothetical protein